MLAGKTLPKDTANNINALEQNLMLNCAAIAKTNAKINCC